MSVERISTKSLGNVGGGGYHCEAMGQYCYSYTYSYPVCNFVPSGGGNFTEVCTTESETVGVCEPIVVCW